MRNNKLQGQITTGRFTLPVVICIYAICWISTSFLLPQIHPERETNYSLWQSLCSFPLPTWSHQIISFLLYAAIGYFLIELNNTFAIIRMRASVQTSIYFLLITACPQIHLLYTGNLAAATFIISLYFLFKSYQHSQPVGHIFNSFFFIGVGSLLFPQLIFFVPIWMIGMYSFQSLSLRSFCSGIVGLSVPYWFLLGHAFFYQKMDSFYQPFIELINFYPIHLIKEIPFWQMITLIYLFILFIVSAIRFFISSYEDKIRTRSYLQFLIFLNLCIFAFTLLQPIHSLYFLSLLLIGISILAGHLFALTNTRLSNIFFIGSMVGLILLFGFNLWILL